MKETGRTPFKEVHSCVISPSIKVWIEVPIRFESKLSHVCCFVDRGQSLFISFADEVGGATNHVYHNL